LPVWNKIACTPIACALDEGGMNGADHEPT
jgi:hypothetical protein